MKANELMKRNIDALLKQRHLSRKDLALWCRRGESWISKIMKEDRREFPMKYWDRIADFFGMAAYQLLQPGIGGHERRSGSDRRTGKDRRLSAMNHRLRESVSAVVANLTPADVADLLALKRLSDGSRDELRDEARRLERSEQQNDARAARRRSAEMVEGRAKSQRVHEFQPRREKKQPPPDA